MRNRVVEYSKRRASDFVFSFLYNLYVYDHTGIRKSKAGRDESKVKAALAKLTASAALSADEGNNDKVGTFVNLSLCDLKTLYTVVTK